jgi:hypothetical protein
VQGLLHNQCGAKRLPNNQIKTKKADSIQKLHVGQCKQQ